MRFVCVLLSEKDAPVQIALAESCLRFTPDIALGERTIFLEISRCRSLYTEESLFKRLQVLFKRFGLTAKVAIASDLPTSFALAVCGARDRKKLPIETLPIYFSPFTFDSQLDKMIQSLRKLGIETLEDFLNLPHPSLAKKFGKQGLLALHRYLYAHQVVWNRFQVAEKILEQTNVESHEALYDFDSIVFLLKRSLDRVLMRTRGLGKLISKMTLKFHLDTYSDLQETEREWTLSFSFPHRSIQAFMDMIRDRVGADLQRKPLPAPVLRIEIEVLETVKGNPSQLQFFSQKEEEQESVDLLVERVIEKLGKENVFYAAPVESYLPERSWKKTMTSAEAAKEAESTHKKKFRQRPLRLFPEPEPIRRFDQYLVLREYRWKLLELIGPERITGEWWIDEPERDYYEAHTDHEVLWIYRSPATGELFLHGVFD